MEQQTITKADIGTITLSDKITVPKVIYCAVCRKETNHTCYLDKNKEIVCECECTHFIKFPLVTNIAELIAAHKKANEKHGLVTAEMEDAARNKAEEEFKKLMK